MSILKTWVIEEIDLGDGNIGHRQSIVNFDAETGDLIRPDDRLNEVGRAEWDRVIALLNANDICHCINGPALADHCLAHQDGRVCRKRGCTS